MPAQRFIQHFNTGWAVAANGRTACKTLAQMPSSALGLGARGDFTPADRLQPDPGSSMGVASRKRISQSLIQHLFPDLILITLVDGAFLGITPAAAVLPGRFIPGSCLAGYGTMTLLRSFSHRGEVGFASGDPVDRHL